MFVWLLAVELITGHLNSLTVSRECRQRKLTLATAKRKSTFIRWSVHFSLHTLTDCSNQVVTYNNIAENIIIRLGVCHNTGKEKNTNVCFCFFPPEHSSNFNFLRRLNYKHVLHTSASQTIRIFFCNLIQKGQLSYILFIIHDM